MTRRGPTEGSLHQRKDGSWTGSLDIGWAGGHRERKDVFGRTRAEAAAKLDALRRQHEQGLPVPDQRTRVGPFLKTWLEDVARPTIRASTCESYSHIVTIHLVARLGRIALSNLSPPDVQETSDALQALSLIVCFRRSRRGVAARAAENGRAGIRR